MKISDKILEDWGDVSEQQVALAKAVLIEELKNLQVGLPTGTYGTLMYIRLNKRIKELKQ